MPLVSAVVVAAALAVAPRAAATIDAEVRAVAALAGEPHIVSAAGVTRDETPILTIENPDAFDSASPKRRLVLVGGDDGRSAGDVVALVRGWTDDMFMAASVLARSGARPGHEGDLDAAARLLVSYADRLQQRDGLFHHAGDAPAAWGRGNGFAAFGLIETLTRMPAAHPSHAKLLDIYRRHMSAVRDAQAPDGAWRQIVDAPGAYREETAPAMLMTAMARGVRLGWIDRSYLPAVQRGWRALAAHITDNGGVIDVCAGTGAGPTRRYYYDRPAVTGGDDRGGAMALVAALEIHELGNIWKSGPH